MARSDPVGAAPRSMPCAFVTFGSFTEAERCIQDLHESLNPLAAEGKALVAKMADMAPGT